MWFLAQAQDGAAAATPPAEASPEDQVQGAMDDAGRLAGDAFRGDTDALWQLVQDYGLPVLWALIILVAALFIGKVLAGMTRRALTRSKIDETLTRFFGKAVYYTVLIFGVIFALSKFGIDVTAFAAILAAAGLAVGMALSGTLSNFAAGVMLLVFRPFKVGDVINAAGITAKVDEIELFTTTFDTFDNRRIIVPNGQIYGSTIENISFHDQRRVDVNVGVAYDADIDRTREVLQKAIDSLAEQYMIEGEGRGSQVMLVDLGDSSVNWVLRFWTPAAEFWTVKEKLTRAAKVHLDEAGIGIPFPQMDVHLDGGLK
jgi:small conductance mechanosensitive channel